MSTEIITPGISTTTSTETAGQATYAGITTGAGVDVPLLRLHLRPEFRYSHWFSSNSTIGGVAVLGFASFLVGPVSAPSPQISQNEASFLLGLSF
jgi:hypothetical protein